MSGDANCTYTFDEFWSRLGASLGRPSLRPRKDDRLRQDLHFDGLSLWHMISFLDLHQAFVPAGLIGSLLTADDVFHHYLVRVTNES